MTSELKKAVFWTNHSSRPAILQGIIHWQSETVKTHLKTNPLPLSISENMKPWKNVEERNSWPTWGNRQSRVQVVNKRKREPRGPVWGGYAYTPPLIFHIGQESALVGHFCLHSVEYRHGHIHKQISTTQTQGHAYVSTCRRRILTLPRNQLGEGQSAVER